jgi:hypothetical protein
MATALLSTLHSYYYNNNSGIEFTLQFDRYWPNIHKPSSEKKLHVVDPTFRKPAPIIVLTFRSAEIAAIEKKMVIAHVKY